jgi:hypothetical protein
MIRIKPIVYKCGIQNLTITTTSTTTSKNRKRQNQEHKTNSL